jgi:Bacteriophage clamp loader A subunit
MSPFDFIKSFNEKTKYLLVSDLDEKDYSPFVVNKGMSFMQECVPFANEMNRYYDLDKKMQHDFYYYGVPKGKRFGKWLKKEANDSSVALLMDYFNINNLQAQKYLDLLSDEQLEIIKNKMSKGGKS